MKAFNEMMERRETVRKAYKETMMAEGEAGRKKGKPTSKRGIANRKANREQAAARLEAIHDKTDANEMRLKPETEHKEKMDATPKEIKEDIITNRAIRAETNAIQAKADAD
jgi:hypothetical protein